MKIIRNIYTSNLKTSSLNTHKTFNLSFLMEKLKSLKNFLNQSSSTSTPTTPSKDEDITEQDIIKRSNLNSSPIQDETQTINSRIQKSFNDSTKRITTLLQFTKTTASTKPNDTINQSTNVSIKRKNRPKFLRSVSSNSFKTKSASADIFELKLQSEIDLEIENLFTQLNINLNDLIKHFSQTCNQSDFKINFNFMETCEQSTETYLKLTLHAQELVIKCIDLYKKIELNCPQFDFDSSIKSNGYRSLLRVFESCANRLLSVLIDLNQRKNKFYFQLKLNNASLPASFFNANIIKDFQLWLRLMEKIDILLQTAYEMQTISLKEFNEKLEQDESVMRLKKFHDGPSLFCHMNHLKEKTIENNLFLLASEHQEAFFGRACGFQFCDSLQKPLTGCAIALASYNDGFEAFSNKENTIQAVTNQSISPGLKRVSSEMSSNSSGTFSNTIGKAAVSVYSTTKYIMDPELRAKKLSHVMRKANVEFCKAFWQLTETSIVQMGSNLVTPTITVNVLKKINLSQSLKLPRTNSTSIDDYVEIKPPIELIDSDNSIQIRILSNEMRQGMQDLDKLQTVESPVSFLNQNSLLAFSSNINTNMSKNLILHVHGGGFIAHSSKSHEIYLKPWCKDLKVPIVSVDYSLAPEHAFPRASEECFYVYAWCLLNKNLLGWTGENIICVGDSAGGVLVTNIVQRAIVNEIRVPDALVPIYTPFLLTYSLSPSRLLSVMDPLLNLGILWRCLAAYSGIDFKTETERYKAILNIDKNVTNSTSVNKNSKIFDRFSMKFSKSESSDSNDELTYENSQIKSSTENDENKKQINEINQENFESSEIFNIAPMSDEDNSEKLVNKKELLYYYEMLGESIFLIDKLRNHKVTYDPYMSPILSSDEVLSKFPKTCLIACNDPFLDDNIEMLKRLKKLDVNAEMLIIDNGSPHGFLNMQSLVDETHEAYEEALDYLRCIIHEFEVDKEEKNNESID